MERLESNHYYRHVKSIKGIVDIHPDRVKPFSDPKLKEKQYLVIVDPEFKSGMMSNTTPVVMDTRKCEPNISDTFSVPSKNPLFTGSTSLVLTETNKDASKITSFTGSTLAVTQMANNSGPKTTCFTGSTSGPELSRSSEATGLEKPIPKPRLSLLKKIQNGNNKNEFPEENENKELHKVILQEN